MTSSCRHCRAIPMSLFFEPPHSDPRSFVLHHTSFKSLESSAAAGCNVCYLLYSKMAPAHLGPKHPCFETSYDQVLFPLRRATTFANDQRVYLHLKSYKYKHSGISPNYLVCRVGASGGDQGVHAFDIEYSDNTDSSTLYPKGHAAISLLQLWLHKCSQTHTRCGVRYDFGFKPTRLIDVGYKGKNPRLIHTTGLSPNSGEYLALSHCWGAEMPSIAKTTKATLSRNLLRIKTKKMPRTFQDAINVTRRLGFKYLWIDSLCIIQDSHEDWQLESALMGKVYSHCYCTLAAAASADCHGGLFPKHSELAILGTERSDPLHPAVLLKPTYDGWEEAFGQSPLNLRGWTLQERELSSRIIYFTKHTMLFECRQARGSERGESRGQAPMRCEKEELVPKTLIKSIYSQRCMDELPLDGESGDNFRWIIEKRHHAWRDMVQGYSQRHLSVPSDKFPGLSGLASELSFLLNDQYVAGLWKRDIICGLSWCYSYDKGTKTFSKSDYGPSWSWAKMCVPINYDLVHSYNKTTRTAAPLEPSHQKLEDPILLNASTIPAGRDPNGTLISAFLQFWGQITHMRWSKTGNCILQGESVPIIWDFLPQSTSDFLLFSLGTIRTGLVLVHDSMHENTYRRVGIVSEIKLSWFTDIELQTIKLV